MSWIGHFHYYDPALKWNPQTAHVRLEVTSKTAALRAGRELAKANHWHLFSVSDDQRVAQAVKADSARVAIAEATRGQP